jgi:O-methyltransferase
VNLPKLSKSGSEKVRDFLHPVFWGAADDRLVVSLIKVLAERAQHGVFFSDNLFTWGKNISMLDDPRFMRAWSDNVESESDKAIIWRRYILACAAYHCFQLEGDFVECGCYTGVGVKTIVDYLGGVEFPKTFWAYDLFEPSAGSFHAPMTELGPSLFAKVKSKFSTYPRVRIVQGKVPDILAKEAPDRICYLHIDMNDACAELGALELLFERVVTGGTIILDDYEWAMSYRGQKLAEDPWFDSRGYRVMPLPTGQGLVMKR